ncbi:MAG: hypothetical protein WC736_09745 [Gallionella sp.]|jgi:hypothetical protein
MMFETYREAYPARSPNLQYKKYDDELIEIAGCYFVLDTTFVHACYAELVVPLDELEGKKLPDTKKFLWVVTPDDVKYAHEKSELAQSHCKRGRLAHTNITGGKEAHSGGQLAFLKHIEDSNPAIVLDGDSSRYSPRSEEELNDIATCFSKTGFDIYSLGWNEEEARSEYVYRSAQVKIVKSQSK